MAHVNARNLNFPSIPPAASISQLVMSDNSSNVALVMYWTDRRKVSAIFDFARPH